MAYDYTMEELVDHLKYLFEQNFGNDINHVYFGDKGLYLPADFRASDGTPKCVVALSPNYNRPYNDLRVASEEYRVLGIQILVMINLIPYFEPNPPEELGERLLVRLTTAIYEYLTRLENVDLDRRVQYTQVGEINWEWQQRGEEAVRTAGIDFEARVLVSRL